MEIPEIEHEGGVWWHEAPLPKARHKCWAQTQAIVTDGLGEERIWRCPCGAICYPDQGGGWLDRNSRRGNSVAQTSFMGDVFMKFFKKGKKRG